METGGAFGRVGLQDGRVSLPLGKVDGPECGAVRLKVGPHALQLTQLQGVLTHLRVRIHRLRRRESSGNMQGSEHAGNIRGASRDQSGSIRWKMCREHLGSMQGSIREHSGEFQGTFVEPFMGR